MSRNDAWAVSKASRIVSVAVRTSPLVRSAQPIVMRLDRTTPRALLRRQTKRPSRRQ